MSPLSGKSRKLEAFLLVLRKELAAQFRIVPSHPGIARILEETEAHLEDTIAELVDDRSRFRDPTARRIRSPLLARSGPFRKSRRERVGGRRSVAARGRSKRLRNDICP